MNLLKLTSLIWLISLSPAFSEKLSCPSELYTDEMGDVVLSEDIKNNDYDLSYFYAPSQISGVYTPKKEHFASAFIHTYNSSTLSASSVSLTCSYSQPNGSVLLISQRYAKKSYTQEINFDISLSENFILKSNSSDSISTSQYATCSIVSKTNCEIEISNLES